MLFVNILTLLVVFLASSFGSTWLLQRNGYAIPRSPQTREDYLIILMKILLFSIIALLLFAILLLLGLNPLRLAE